jgi:hypothetical protein
MKGEKYLVKSTLGLFQKCRPEADIAVDWLEKRLVTGLRNSTDQAAASI